MRCQGREEFLEDLLRIKYLKRLFRKYNELGWMEDVRIRLALNHIIIFFNVFKIYPAARMLYLRMEPELYPILKTFLVHLNYQSGIIHGINGHDVEAYLIPVDEIILEKLKNL
jgi:hypothetical protein